MDSTRTLSVYISHFVENLSPRLRQIIWALIDLFSFALGAVFSAWLLNQSNLLNVYFYLLFTSVAYLLYAVFSYYNRLNRSIMRYINLSDLFVLFIITLLSVFLSSAVTYFWLDDYSTRLTLLTGLLSSGLIAGCRILWLIVYQNSRQSRRLSNLRIRNALVIGAGDGGSIFMRHYKQRPTELNVIGLIDQDPGKKGLVLGGVKVLGNQEQIPELVKRYNIEEAIIAIPSMTPSQYEEIFKICNRSKIKVYKMPPIEEVVQGFYKYPERVSEVEITDLLGRQEVILDDNCLRQELSGKTILVTGAGGSIGSEICRQLLRYTPRRILLLGHGENSIYTIYNELKEEQTMISFEPIIADVQDYERILAILETYQPDIVYHAAAHKHVPLMEYNPEEAYKNNIIGTYNVARAVDQAKVPKMVMISTDKAVRPPNVMGATKRFAELIMTGMNEVSESNYCAVRFGNVLGSRGSVVPLFQKQIKEGGPVQVTDYRMTRYFMTIPEASRLVIYAGAKADGGEVMVLKMGEAVKILDLAKKMIMLSGYTLDQIPIVEIGMRPGEKLYEELLTANEEVLDKVDDNVYIGRVNIKSMDEIKEKINEWAKLKGAALKEAIVAYANRSSN